MDFYMKMGEVVDGKTVQALVTKVNRVYELSVVWMGADPGAKTHNSQSFSQEVSVDPKKLALALGISLGDDPTEEAITAALKEQAAKALELQTQLTAAETVKTDLTTQVTALTADVTTKVVELGTATTELTTLKAAVEALKANATLGEKLVVDTRNEALRLYNLVEATKANDTMRNLISNSDLAVAQSFISTYKERAEQIAPLHCVKCGSAELSRQLSQQTDPGNIPDTHNHTNMETERLKASVTSIHG